MLSKLSEDAMDDLVVAAFDWFGRGLASVGSVDDELVTAGVMRVVGSGNRGMAILAPTSEGEYAMRAIVDTHRRAGDRVWWAAVQSAGAGMRWRTERPSRGHAKALIAAANRRAR